MSWNDLVLDHQEINYFSYQAREFLQPGSIRQHDGRPLRFFRLSLINLRRQCRRYLLRRIVPASVCWRQHSLVTSTAHPICRQFVWNRRRNELPPEISSSTGGAKLTFLWESNKWKFQEIHALRNSRKRQSNGTMPASPSRQQSGVRSKRADAAQLGSWHCL